MPRRGGGNVWNLYKRSPKNSKMKSATWLVASLTNFCRNTSRTRRSSGKRRSHCSTWSSLPASHVTHTNTELRNCWWTWICSVLTCSSWWFRSCKLLKVRTLTTCLSSKQPASNSFTCSGIKSKTNMCPYLWVYSQTTWSHSSSWTNRMQQRALKKCW